MTPEVPKSFVGSLSVDNEVQMEFTSLLGSPLEGLGESTGFPPEVKEPTCLSPGVLTGACVPPPPGDPLGTEVGAPPPPEDPLGTGLCAPPPPEDPLGTGHGAIASLPVPPVHQV